jgi:hypothetical protein
MVFNSKVNQKISKKNYKVKVLSLQQLRNFWYPIMVDIDPKFDQKSLGGYNWLILRPI